jgi:hypothetical protein
MSPLYPQALMPSPSRPHAITPPHHHALTIITAPQALTTSPQALTPTLTPLHAHALALLHPEPSPIPLFPYL